MQFFIAFGTVTNPSPETKTESLSYSITKDNKSIGQIHIERKTKNDIIEYFFESNAYVDLIFYDLHVYDKMNVVFKENNLVQAKLFRSTNGIVQVNNRTTWNGTNYSLLDKDGENGFIKEPIPLTTANLYFIEPVKEKFVFSEKFQCMIPIKSIGNNRYQMQLPNGNKATYCYQNGICNMVEAQTDWAVLKFILNS